MTLEFSDTILPSKEEFQMTVKGSTRGKDGPLAALGVAPYSQPSVVEMIIEEKSYRYFLMWVFCKEMLERKEHNRTL